MPGLVPGIHVFLSRCAKDVDGRDKPGHDGVKLNVRRTLAPIMSLRLIFMGTPDFAVPTLLELVAHGHEVVAVYTRAPKPAGRGMKLQPTPGRAGSAAARHSRADADAH